MIVWWTIPDSAVAWSWDPEGATFTEATLVRTDDGDGYLLPRATSAHRWPGSRRPAGGPLAEMTAYFAMEANIRPTGMAITWIRGEAAVRWDRGSDRWSRHRVGTHDGHRCLRRGSDVPGAPRPRDVEHAADIALDLLDAGRP